MKAAGTRCWPRCGKRLLSEVTLKESESLRQFSERLLGDGDAWQLLLRYNGKQQAARQQLERSTALAAIPIRSSSGQSDASLIGVCFFHQ